jgi:PIN domain
MDVLSAYLQWVNEAARLLHNQVGASDIDRLVLTRRYELLLAMTGRLASDRADAAVNALVSTELDERTAAFEEACQALERQIERWSGPEVFVILDTSVFLEHPAKLEELDLAPIIGVRGEPIHVLVPIVVIDELDGLKQHRDRKVRWRAGYTLAVLDRVLQRPTAVARLRDGDFSALSSGGIPRGEISVEVLFDPPGHVRLPINDDEIIDRALAVEPLAARTVTLVTYDTGQCMRARAAGLHAKKLSKLLGEEPE